MNPKSMQLMPVSASPVSLEDMNADAVREHVAQATRDFKNSWRNLAAALQAVWKEKLYEKWGYTSFDTYTAKEVRIRKHTAMKLIRSYLFLKNEEPSFLQSDTEETKVKQSPPTFEMVSTLQRAKRSLDEGEYQQVKKALCEDGKDFREVKKDLTALIIRKRKDLDPEAERTRHAKAAITRALSELRALKRDVEVSEILPASLAVDIAALIEKIEKYSAPESKTP
jgi:hypothetical protein